MARRKLDRIVVVDVEATCWEGAPPADEVSEIIEVGVCLLDVAAGERVFRQVLNGISAARPRAAKNILSVMPMRAIPVHLWTGPFWRATPTGLLRV